MDRADPATPSPADPGRVGSLPTTRPASPAEGVSGRAARPVLIGLLVLCGCGQSWQPLDYPTATVRGRVRFRGQPVRGGWVEFYPLPPTVGHRSTAMIGPEGTYHARRVAVGTHRVQVVRTQPLLPRAYRKVASPLRAHVLPDRVNTLDVDVEPPSGVAGTQTPPAAAPASRPDRAGAQTQPTGAATSRPDATRAR